MPGWLSWLGIWLRLRSWSWGPGVESHFRHLAQWGVYLSHSLCLPPLPTPLCSLSLKLIRKPQGRKALYCIYRKNLHVSGLTQLKTLLLKGQLYYFHIPLAALPLPRDYSSALFHTMSDSTVTEAAKVHYTHPFIFTFPKTTPSKFQWGRDPANPNSYTICIRGSEDHPPHPRFNDSLRGPRGYC